MDSQHRFMSHQRPLWIILIHLIKDTTWPSGNKDRGAGGSTAKRRDKWIQQTLTALKLFHLDVAVKTECGLRVLHCMVNELGLYNAIVLRVMQIHLSYCFIRCHITSQFTHTHTKAFPSNNNQPINRDASHHDAPEQAWERLYTHRLNTKKHVASVMSPRAICPVSTAPTSGQWTLGRWGVYHASLLHTLTHLSLKVETAFITHLIHSWNLAISKFVYLFKCIFAQSNIFSRITTII